MSAMEYDAEKANVEVSLFSFRLAVVEVFATPTLLIFSDLPKSTWNSMSRGYREHTCIWKNFENECAWRNGVFPISRPT